MKTLYRKKSVVVEAARWFTGEVPLGGTVVKDKDGNPMYVHIQNLDGIASASNGDWIIKDSKGKFYPCKPDIFEAEYEKIEE